MKVNVGATAWPRDAAMQFDHLHSASSSRRSAARWPRGRSRRARSGLLAGAQLDDRMLSAVRQGLKEAGYVEGRNVAIKYRSFTPSISSNWTAKTCGPSRWRRSRRRSRACCVGAFRGCV
jgi:hypothetical protein